MVDRTVAILADPGEAWAAELGKSLGAPCVAEPGPGARFLLARAAGRLELRWNDPRAPGPVAIDFLAGPGARRFRGPPRDRGLAQAIGIARGLRTVVDATAGLGRDAYGLACLGCAVTAVERSPVIAALLADALARAGGDPAAAARLGGRLQVVRADARDWLAALAPQARPDAVYIDPLLGRDVKSALAKKEMQLLQELLGPDEDALQLLEVARATARRRTVVKRPRRAPPLVADPTFQVATTRVRWDVYAA